jgi:hypothetical protein
MFIKFDGILLNIEVVKFFDKSDFGGKKIWTIEVYLYDEDYRSWKFKTKKERDTAWKELCLLAEEQFKANF